jgi:D-lactate dehydrogenase (quinone)
MLALKGRFDALCSRFGFFPRDLSERIMQFVGSLFPRHLPSQLYDFRDRFEHHLILRMADDGIEEARAYLESLFSSAKGAYFRCTPEEGAKAFLHRFAAAGAAIRYRAVHRQEAEDIVALDIALPRNGTSWVERLPDGIEAKLMHKLYYGHFFCQVFHQDYIVKKGFDPIEVEHAMWDILDSRGAEYPAEHNVGHLYHAKPALKGHYQALDPTNSFNPGIGHTSKCAHWR